MGSNRRSPDFGVTGHEGDPTFRERLCNASWEMMEAQGRPNPQQQRREQQERDYHCTCIGLALSRPQFTRECARLIQCALELIYDRAGRDGPAAVTNFIRDHLNPYLRDHGGYQISVREDAATTERVRRSRQQQGLSVPGYIRLLEVRRLADSIENRNGRVVHRIELYPCSQLAD